MSKELDALENVKKFKDDCCMFGSSDIEIDRELDIIENALKNYQELLERPCVFVGRTRGHEKALIDMISKNYKEIKITNLDDEKKLKAFEIIKEKRVDVPLLISYIKEKPNDEWALSNYNSICEDRIKCKYYEGRDYLKSLPISQQEYKLLKEVLL